MTRISFVAAWLLQLALSACGARTRSIALDYPPEAGSRHALPVAAVAPGKEAALVSVELFHDARRYPPVGETRTRWDRHTGMIESEQPVSAWVKRGIEFELERLGVPLAHGEGAGIDQPPATPALRLEGRIREAFASQRFFIEARVYLYAWLRCSVHGEILLARTYEGNALIEEEERERHGEALGRALEQAAGKLAADVRNAGRCPRSD